MARSNKLGTNNLKEMTPYFNCSFYLIILLVFWTCFTGRIEYNETSTVCSTFTRFCREAPPSLPGYPCQDQTSLNEHKQTHEHSTSPSQQQGSSLSVFEVKSKQRGDLWQLVNSIGSCHWDFRKKVGLYCLLGQQNDFSSSFELIYKNDKKSSQEIILS